MPDESMKNTIIVSVAVCIVCSLLVSTAEVNLRDLRYKNKKLYKVQNILKAAELPNGRDEAFKVYEERVRPVLVDLQTGVPVPESEYNEVLNVDKFDIKKLASDPRYGRSIPDREDIAQLGRMPSYIPIYFILEEEKIRSIVFPLVGHGIWSTLHGFIALERDLITVRGFTIYEHGETPGLGGEVDNPRWKSTWKGKQAFDEQGNLRISVIKGDVDTSRPNARHQIEGLSGATLTTHGVDNMVRFWLGEHGYSALIEGLRKDINGYL